MRIASRGGQMLSSHPLVEKEALITAGLAVLTFAAFGCWFLMARRPQQWAAWVERENDFWRAKGLLPATFAEKLKGWEKGRTLRLLAGITTCIGLIGLALTLVVWMKAVVLRHQRIRMPYNPALQVRPARPVNPGKPKK